MSRIPVHGGRVCWSGENPFIYLKNADDEEVSALCLYFRVNVSPHGIGHAFLILRDPDARRQPVSDEPPNFCLTDNRPLAKYLVSDFVTRFGLFRDRAGLAHLEYVRLDAHDRAGDGRIAYEERGRGEGLDVSMSWSQLQEPFAAELDAEHTATGQHEMFSVFVEAREARVLVNGRALDGRLFSRDFLGNERYSASLVFSETWVEVP